MKNELLSRHGEFCDEALLRNYRQSTVRWWQDALRMLRGFFGERELLRVRDVTLDRLRTYFAAKRASGWTAHTYSNQYRALKAFLDWCVGRGLLAASPLDAIPDFTPLVGYLDDAGVVTAAVAYYSSEIEPYYEKI